MCGVAGCWSVGALESSELEKIARSMSETISHRGPDDAGVWADSDAGIALAHRRLAIVDLSPAGHQPMHSASSRFVVVFNGEIYNFRELRQELEQQGHH